MVRLVLSRFCRRNTDAAVMLQLATMVDNTSLAQDGLRVKIHETAETANKKRCEREDFSEDCTCLYTG